MSGQQQSYVEAARRDKLAALRERGIDPFAYGYSRTHTAREAVHSFSADRKVPVDVAGRIIALRPHGKTTFGLMPQPHLLFFYLDAQKTPEYLVKLRHEYAHWVWGRMYGEAPSLFWEGMATYGEHASAGPAGVNETLTAGFNVDEIPSLQEAARNETFWQHKGMYTAGSWVTAGRIWCGCGSRALFEKKTRSERPPCRSMRWPVIGSERPPCPSVRWPVIGTERHGDRSPRNSVEVNWTQNIVYT